MLRRFCNTGIKTVKVTCEDLCIALSLIDKHMSYSCSVKCLSVRASHLPCCCAFRNHPIELLQEQKQRRYLCHCSAVRYVQYGNQNSKDDAGYITDDSPHSYNSNNNTNKSNSSSSSGGKSNDNSDNFDPMMEFDFDPMASVRHDAAVQSAQQSLDTIVATLVPPQTPASALVKVREYLKQHPIDSLIVHTHIQITHVENSETGKEEKLNRSNACSLEQALAQAQERQMNLVQMGERPGMAFCRIRHERPWILKMIKEELESAGVSDINESSSSSSSSAGSAAEMSLSSSSTHDSRAKQPQSRKDFADEEVDESNMSNVDKTHSSNDGNNIERTSTMSRRPRKVLPVVEHTFRDMVDAHFVGWRSKKICQDLRKGHTVRLCIKEFQSSETAVHKLKEMCAAMKSYAEQENIEHYYTTITTNEKEARISFSPVLASSAEGGGSGANKAKGIKHPTEKEWVNAERRMREACDRVGRLGTYMKSNKLKPRNLGTTFYRVDKYGRRTDEEQQKLSIPIY